MIRFLIIIGFISYLFPVEVVAQEKITEKKILGTWRLYIDISDEMDELRDEADESDSYLGKLFLRSISGFVEGIINGLEIYMDIQPNGDVEVTTIAFGEEDMDYSRWRIENGRLYISDSKNFNVADTDYWLLEDHRTMRLYDADNKSSNSKNKQVFLKRIE